MLVEQLGPERINNISCSGKTNGLQLKGSNLSSTARISLGREESKISLVYGMEMWSTSSSNERGSI